MNNSARNTCVQGVSFLIALWLMLVPIPSSLKWFRPEFLLLVLIHWVFSPPSRVGVVTAWCIGLMMDILGGLLLGQYAFNYCCVVFLAQLLRGRSALFPMWRKLLVIALLLSVQMLLQILVQWLIGKPPRTVLFVMPVFTSLLVWPWLHRGLDYISQNNAHSLKSV